MFGLLKQACFLVVNLRGGGLKKILLAFVSVSMVVVVFSSFDLLLYGQLRCI